MRIIILTTLLITFISTTFLFSQRNKTKDSRGNDPNRIERLEKRRNTQNLVPQKKIITYTPKPIEKQSHPESHYCIKPTPNLEGDCVQYYPPKYSFPDRVYKIPGIKEVMLKFEVEDYDGVIKLLTQKIEYGPFYIELHFLRGVAYLKRESDFKNPDYYAAEWDFNIVKTLDPQFEQLSHYIELLDFYLYGKQPVGTRTVR